MGIFSRWGWFSLGFGGWEIFVFRGWGGFDGDLEGFFRSGGGFDRDFEGFSVLTSKVPNFNTLSGALFGKMTTSI